jgi:hypothetical protein
LPDPFFLAAVVVRRLCFAVQSAGLSAAFRRFEPLRPNKTARAYSEFVNAVSPLYLANVTAERNTAHGIIAKQKLAIDSIWYQRLFP